MTASDPLLVLGTHNAKKRRELEELFAPLGIVIHTLDDYPEALEVVEDGDSFAANARLKASQQALHLNRWVLGEDSGLQVDALGGAPGIYSARYAGPNATDDDNNRQLLAELGDRPLDQRWAQYVCHMSLSDPQGKIHAESEEHCRGRIRFDAAGAGGFGYDPLFEVVEYHRTFGELGPAVKAALSHRGRAMRQLAPQLARLIARGVWR